MVFRKFINFHKKNLIPEQTLKPVLNVKKKEIIHLKTIFNLKKLNGLFHNI